MTDRFRVGPQRSNVGETFQLEEIPQIDAGKFEAIERAAIERVITEQQALLTQVQTDVLDVRTERNALQHQLSELETERQQLQDRLEELEVQRPSLEPKAVFSNLGAALEEVDADLASERYSVDDVEFKLKTNVIQTEEGMRMHLPSLDETWASENLSEVSFRLRAPKREPERTGSDYTEVPDLRGLPHETAARRLAGANLTVGTVETIVDASQQPGTVLEQFPDAHAVAELEAPVDFVLAEAPEDQPEEEPTTETEASPEDESADEPTDEPTDEPKDESAEEPTDEPGDEPTDSDTTTPTGNEESDSPTDEAGTESEEDETSTDSSDERANIEEFRRVIVEADPESESEIADRLHRAGIDDIDSLSQRDPEELAEQLSIPVERIVALQEQLETHHETTRLEEISGIGSTYATRLRTEGIQSVAQLAELDPETVSEITNASTSRTSDWIEQARRLLQ